MKVLIQRLSQDDTQTVGNILILGAGQIQQYCSLELPWRNNQPFESCIPAGKYRAIKYVHPKRKNSLVLFDVPGRTDIMMHVANFSKQLSGCIAPGVGFKDIDQDGHLDVVESRVAMDMIYDTLPGNFIIEITKAP